MVSKAPRKVDLNVEYVKCVLHALEKQYGLISSNPDARRLQAMLFRLLSPSEIRAFVKERE